MRVWGMRTGITVHLNSTDRKRLQALVDDPNSPQKHVWRAPVAVGACCRVIFRRSKQSIGGFARFVRDYEQRIDVSEAMIHVALGSLLIRQIAH